MFGAKIPLAKTDPLSLVILPDTGRLPDKVDTRMHSRLPYPQIVDQKSKPLCTAEVVKFLVYFAQSIIVDPSQLYNRSRSMEMSAERRYVPQEQEGVPLDVALQAASDTYGVRPVRLWPSISNLQRSLSLGFPFGFAFILTDEGVAWMRDRTAQIGTSFVYPSSSVFATPVASHAVVAVGFDAQKQLFLIRNSFGQFWGDEGHFFIPFQAILEGRYAASEFFIVL